MVEILVEAHKEKYLAYRHWCYASSLIYQSILTFKRSRLAIKCALEGIKIVTYRQKSKWLIDPNCKTVERGRFH